MEEKLIKTVDGYELFTQGFLKGSTNHGLIESLNIEEGLIRYTLSLKNCQAIELGYDLDELAKTFEDENSDSFHSAEMIIGFKGGFQKALEILGDKKFSEKKMLEFGEYVWKHGGRERSMKQLLSDYKTLQQTEWDVEIEMEKVAERMPGIMVFTKTPKLDADGCLILKRKQYESIG